MRGRLHPLDTSTNAKQRIGFSAVAFAKDGTAFTGGSDGKLYRWKGASPVGKPEQLHPKMISTLNIVDVKGKEYLLTGSTEQTVNVYQINAGALAKLHTIPVGASPRSLDMIDNKILIGLNNGTIKEHTVTTNSGQDLIQSHHDGEVWGLSVVDKVDTYKYITAGDDDKLLLYDIQLRKVIG